MRQEFHPSTSRHRIGTRRRTLGLLLMLVIVAGCNTRDPSNRQALSGLITFKGTAIEDGVILLEPLAPNGPEIAVGATIRRGAFAIAPGRGPTPGAYRVRIYSGAGVQAPPSRKQSERTRRPMVERIPSIYNTRSELRMDVINGGSNRLILDVHDEGEDRPEIPPSSPDAHASGQAQPERGESPR